MFSDMDEGSNTFYIDKNMNLEAENKRLREALEECYKYEQDPYILATIDNALKERDDE